MIQHEETYDRFEEGDRCPVPRCDGILEYPPVVNCSCHINPPCSACVEQVLECSDCGWSQDIKEEIE